MSGARFELGPLVAGLGVALVGLLALLDSRGVPYDEINLAKDPGGRAELVSLTGQMTFPQILIENRPLGGFRELLEADRDGVLDDLLAA